jgi:hypothetical protein
VLSAVCFSAPVLGKQHDDRPPKFQVRIEAPLADVIEAVRQVTQDQIVHGTYSYEKERILYGAHSTAEASVFGAWKGEGTAFYKVVQNVLAPRNFKDTGDIGTISVRYVVQAADANASVVQVEAVFVDARNLRHPSLGEVESSESTAIQQHLRTIQEQREKPQHTVYALADEKHEAASGSSTPAVPLGATNTIPSALPTVPELQKQVDELRHQVELRVRYDGAQLKSAPYHNAATLESLAPETEVLIVVVTPYWYGVESAEGHHGWVHHSQLEPLP